MRVLLATLAVTFSLAACARPSDEASGEDPRGVAPEAEVGAEPRTGGESMPKTIDDFRAESLAAIDKEACAAKGGEVRQEGILGGYRCTVPYADAGKACAGKADCEGKCLAPPELEAETGAAATGACQANDSPFGCYAEIIDGKIAEAICVD